MVDRLSAVDVSFLYLEGPTTPMHLGNLAVFDATHELTYERLVALVRERIAQVPRYRQKVVWVPGHLANPVWADDPDFDLNYHIRRSALPSPGSDDQLREFCARIQSRPLDRQRPLWEMYLIEGLADGRIAVATKTHYAMVDGDHAIDLAQVMLDPVRGADEPREPLWLPRALPGRTELVLEAVSEIVRRPTGVLDTVRLVASDLRSSADRAITTATGVLGAVGALAVRPRSSALRVTTGERRRFATVATSLTDFRQIHADQDVAVNDVVLAVVTGALREWLLQRGEPVQQGTVVRAMVPLSVRDPAVAAGDSADGPGQIAPLLVDLPVGEPNPLVRLSQLAFSTREHAQSGQAIRAQTLLTLSGFAPPTLHAMAARVGRGLSNRLFQLAVTNAPGPQFPLFAAGARLRDIYPIVPIGPGQALAIGVISYDGGVYFGLNADYDSMSDVVALATLIEQSLSELVSANVQSHGAPDRRRRLASVSAVDGSHPSSKRSKSGAPTAPGKRTQKAAP